MPKDVRSFSEAEVERLVKFYEQAEREILDQLNRALLRGNKTEYLAQMKKNIESILTDLRAGNRTWCEEAIPRVYSQGLYSADAMLKDAGVSVKTGFGAIHQEAAQILAENTFQSLDHVAQVIGRRATDIYRSLALENIRGSVVGYDTWKQVAQRYREQLAEHGVTGFKDAANRNWNMRTYAEMVARTTTMEAHLQGTANRLVEQGHDLVKVSTHRGACEKCLPWQGKILSITGKTPGYPTLEEAKAAGLFHPNCRHAYGLHIDLDEEIEELGRELEQHPKGIESHEQEGYTLKGDVVRNVIINTVGHTKVIVPKDLDATKQHITAKEIVNTLEKMPERLRKVIDEVQILDYRNPDDTYWEKVYNIPGFRSFATGGNRQIHFYENGHELKKHVIDYLPSAMAHEMGHNLDRELGKNLANKVFSAGKDWTEAMKKDYNISKKQYVSGYAEQAKSNLEDFADSVADFILDKQNFETNFPHRADVLRGLGL
ncbi:MAG: hypothetical protein HPY66_3156 [Firmicutes bacterium]|nr:hypothetical protein [Bacillota bacterium]